MRKIARLWLFVVCLIAVVSAAANSRFGIQETEVVAKDNRATTLAGCSGQSPDGSDNKWSIEKCTFPSNLEPIGQVLVLGDSTAASLSDAVIRAASELSLSTVVFSTRGCPFAIRQPYTYEWCGEVFAENLALVELVKPIAVIISNNLSRMDLEDRRIRFKNGTLPKSLPQRLDSTVIAVKEALTQFRKKYPSIPVLFVHEIPTIPFQTAPTLLNQRRSAFTINSSSNQFRRQRKYILVVEQTIKNLVGVKTVNPFDFFCNSNECSAKSSDGKILYLDSYHLNPLGSLVLQPEVSIFLKDTLSLSLAKL